MALKTLCKITSELREAATAGTEPFTQATSIQKCLIAHRVGVVPPTETSIVVVAATGHRKESFQACEWLLEQVKLRAPIWKKECYAGGPDVQASWKENFPKPTVSN